MPKAYNQGRYDRSGQGLKKGAILNEDKWRINAYFVVAVALRYRHFRKGGLSLRRFFEKGGTKLLANTAHMPDLVR